MTTAPLDLHAALEAMLPDLQRRLAASITLSFEPALLSAPVPVDAGALRQAVLALVDNATAAMPKGGILTVRTEHVDVAGGELGPVPTLTAGPHLRITVQDTGTGMDEAARVRAMDVTTGDSRGMAVVIDMVRRAGGALWLDSAPAHGTRAFVYLPIDAAHPLDSPSVVLLVEDESAVRSVVRRVLRSQGFTVREARDGESALRVWHTAREEVVAVVTDVVMPVMGGRDLARELRALDPSVPVLFMSAYAEDEPGLLDGVQPPRLLLGKPFTNATLLAALRGLLPLAH